MNKAELINALAQKTDSKQVEAKKAINGLLEIITETLSKGEKVTLVGFGTFSIEERAARKGYNPSTKQAIEIPARKIAKFKVGSELAKAVDK